MYKTEAQLNQNPAILEDTHLKPTARSISRKSRFWLEISNAEYQRGVRSAYLAKAEEAAFVCNQSLE
jgi:hypothetical protein